MRVALASVVVVVVVVIVSAVASCGERYEPVCRVGERQVVEERGISPLALTIQERPGGGVALAWLDRAPLAGAAGPTLIGRTRAFAPDASSEVGGDFEAPSALAARRGSTTEVGVLRTREGALFHWTETAIDTAPDGLRTRAEQIVLQLRRDDQSEGAVLRDPRLACADCLVTTAFVALGSTRVGALVRTTRAAEEEQGEDLRFFLFDESGIPQAEVDLTSVLVAPPPSAADGGLPAGGLGASPAEAAFSLAATGDERFFVARLGRRAALVRADGRFESGFELPPGSVALDGSTVAWALQTPGTNLGNVFVERRGVAPLVRVSTGSWVDAVRTTGDHTAVLFTAGGVETYLALAGPKGKAGGDLAIATGSATAAQNATQRVLAAKGDRNFVLWVTDGRELSRQEIVCAP